MTGAHYPNPYADLPHEQNVLIGLEHITIGDVTLPTCCILEGGVTVKPDTDTGNQLTITMMVGSVDITPEAITRVRVEPKTDTTDELIIGTIECPVDGCTDRLSVTAKAIPNTEAGTVGLAVKAAREALAHMNTHSQSRS